MATSVAAWPTVALGEVLRRSEDTVAIAPETEYAQVTVRLWGKGVVLRGCVMGSQIAASSQLRVRQDQFILSRIDARNGAFGVVPADLDGAVVSKDFPTFNLEQSRIIPAYMGWLSKTRDFVEMCQRASEGTTNRVRLKEDRFLAATIPLPPLDEQRRIVARIEALAAHIAEARGLRRAALAEAAQLMRSAIADALGSVANWTDTATVESVARSVTDGDHQPPPKAEIGVPFLFISNIVNGRVDMTGCKWVTPDYFSALSPSRVPEPGDVLYTAVGSYGIPCLVNTDEPFCFQRHIAIIKPQRDIVTSEYLAWALASPAVFEQATAWATGSAQLTVPLSAIRKLRLPLPDQPTQRHIVTYLNAVRVQVTSLDSQQAETASNLDALLPSILDKAFRGEL